MAIIYDFVKYKADKEIDAYESELLTEYCVACPECQCQEFTIYLDNTLECLDCEARLRVEWEE